MNREPRANGLRSVPVGYAFAGLLVALLALVLGLRSASTPEPRDASAPDDQFAVARALPTLERLIGDGEPHPVGTEANARMRTQVIAELEALGLNVTTQTALSCVTRFNVCGEVVNVMARLPGQSDGPAVLLTAHYDSVGAGPGVSDDLAGTAAILETARLLLAEEPLPNPFIVLITDGEEVGLLGAEAFTHHDWFADVGVVINVEARGSSGQSLMFETNVGNAWLIDAFARQAPRPAATSLLYEIYNLLPNDTDFSIYKDAGLNGLNFAFAENVAHYHTVLDDLRHLDLGSFQHHGDNILAAARALGSADLNDPPAGNAIYLDLVPGSLIRAPEGWAIPLAAFGLLIWLFIAAALVRLTGLTFWSVLLGVFTALLSLVVAAALGYGVTAAVQALGSAAQPWYSTPLPMRVAVWLAALLGVVATSSLFARWLGFWGAALGAWLVWSLAAIFTAVALPGASIVFLVPLIVATLAFALALSLSGLREGGPTIGAPVAAASLVAIFAAGYVWLPFALVVEQVMGLSLSAAVALCLGLVFITLMPLLAVGATRSTTGAGSGAGRLPLFGRTLRAPLMLACFVGVLVAGVFALRVPVFTADMPQRFNVVHVQAAADDGTPQATWLLDRSPDSRLPEAFAALGDFKPIAPFAFPTMGWYLYSEAPALPVELPTVEVVADERSEEARVVGLRLHPGTGRDWLTLSLPNASGPTRLLLPGTEYEMDLISADSPEYGMADFLCHGPICDGLELELHRTDPQGFEVTLQGSSYGLPAEAEPLLAARPATAVQSQNGDASVVVARLLLP